MVNGLYNYTKVLNKRYRVKRGPVGIRCSQQGGCVGVDNTKMTNNLNISSSRYINAVTSLGYLSEERTKV